MANEPLPSIEELGRKIDAMRPAPTPQEWPHQSQGVGMAMRVGIEMVAGTCVGAAVGYGLDRWFGTLPLFLIICFLLGTAAGILTVIRSTRMQQVETTREIAAEDSSNEQNNR